MTTALHVLRKVTLALREVPGGVLAGDLIRKAFGHGQRMVEVRDFDGDLRMKLNLGEHMQSQIFWHGSYSRNILFLLRKVLKPGMTVIDAGANIGEISLVAAKRVGPVGKVVAFEPVDRFADELEANATANQLWNIVVRRAALSDIPGEATIYVSPGAYSDGTMHEGLGTLFPTKVRSAAEGRIPVMTLDGFVREEAMARIDLIKLDIEGSELNALKGGVDVMREFKPALIIEVGEDTCRSAGYEMLELFSFVQDLGYSISRIGRRGRLDPIDRTGLVKFQNLFCAARETVAA